MAKKECTGGWSRRLKQEEDGRADEKDRQEPKKLGRKPKRAEGGHAGSGGWNGREADKKTEREKVVEGETGWLGKKPLIQHEGWEEAEDKRTGGRLER